MKNNTTTKSMRRSLPVFAQIVQLIPAGLIGKLAEACRIEARNFPYAHQIYALLLGQLAGAFSLNEICDAMAVHFKKLFRVRGLLPARRNTFSNANRTRDPPARLRRLRVHHPARYPLPADPPPRRLPPARPRRHPRPPRLQLRVPPPARRVAPPPAPPRLLRQRPLPPPSARGLSMHLETGKILNFSPFWTHGDAHERNPRLQNGKVNERVVGTRLG
ncbi:MAG: DUF4372 domain-containing protein [Kiritimatiellae bacterium]|nr:DUF4372 domain-containing protein [Kiritimatiellia bacterium]